MKKQKKTIAEVSGGNKRGGIFSSNVVRFGIALVGIVGIIVAISIVANLPESNPSETSTSTSATPTATTIEKIERSLTGKTLSEDQAEVAATVQVLLNSTNVVDDSKKPSEVLEALDSGDLSSFHKEEFLSHLHFPAYLENDKEEATRIVAQGLYTVASFASVYGGGTISPASVEALLSVPVDQELGIAHVPASIFTGEESSLHLTMVYVDDEWKLDVLSFVNVINTAASGTETED